jgi:type 1 glutamine amidotransferase
MSSRAPVLALIGDRYHNADYIRLALGRIFRELNVAVDFTINYEEIGTARLQDYRLFITFRDGYIWPDGYQSALMYPYASYLENRERWPAEKPVGWITEEQGQAIQQFVEAGNGLYAYHNSGYISLYSKNYREVMGGVTLQHPPLRPFRVRVVRDHPITQGVQDFMVNDEQHYVTFDKDPKNIILESENVDGLSHGTHGTKAIGGWAYDYGKGRVAFTAVGHNMHALWQPEYVKIQRNAIRWLLRMT